MNTIQLCIFHYHLQKGGVTDVILRWVQLIIEEVERVFTTISELHILICVGYSENIIELQDRFLKEMNNISSSKKTSILLQLKFAIDNKLNYQISNPPNPTQEIALLARHLQTHYISQQHTETIWWIHNYHLGKNPYLSAAFLQVLNGLKLPPQDISSQKTSIKVLLHIHDFPESGRLRNYQSLVAIKEYCYPFTSQVDSENAKNTIEYPALYPIHSNIYYATINFRDQKILLEAGIPAKQVCVLPNPMHLTQSHVANQDQLKQQFYGQFQTLSSLIQERPHAPIALYPVRCIRRKNHIEIAIINCLLKKKMNIICTLPGISSPEATYSQLIQKLYQKNIMKGVFGIGLILEENAWSFAKLYQAADMIISTSIMEGFGYTYFDAIYAEKALIARKIDTLSGFEHLFSANQSTFYNQINIPISQNAPFLNLKNIQNRYSSYIESKNVSKTIKQQLQIQFSTLLDHQRAQSIDFPYLPIDLQYQVLILLSQSNTTRLGHFFWRECQEANRLLIDKINHFIANIQNCQMKFPCNHTKIEQHFSPRSLSKVLNNIFSYLLEQTEEKKRDSVISSETDQTISKHILISFCQRHYHYALLWDEEWKKYIEYLNDTNRISS